MSCFDLTPARKQVPDATAWSNTFAQLPISINEEEYLHSLRSIERERNLRVRLNDTNVYANNWGNELLDQITEHSYPLRGLIESNASIQINREWLGYWELYSQFLIPCLLARLEDKRHAAFEAAKKRALDRKAPPPVKPPVIRGFSMHSFHIFDNGSCIQPLQKALGKVEFRSSIPITHEWLVVRESGQTKDNDKSITCVDGDRMTTANMRAWKNQIFTRLKHADMIVDAFDAVDKPACIAFALTALAPQGCAIIRMPKITTTSTISLVHLFSQCFDTTVLRHVLADDCLYLCGSGFREGFAYVSILYDYCDACIDSPNVSPFTREYMDGDGFQQTLEVLINATNRVNASRYKYYERVFRLYDKLRRSNSNKLFENYAAVATNEEFPDRSADWVKATGFDYFTEV